MMAGFKLSKISAILRGEYKNTQSDRERTLIRNIAVSMADKFVQADDRFDRNGWYKSCGLPAAFYVAPEKNDYYPEPESEPVVAAKYEKLGSTDAESFAYALETKLRPKRHGGLTVWVKGGYKFDKIMMADGNGHGAHIHAFVEKDTGFLCKAASMSAPARRSDKSLMVKFDLSTAQGFDRAVRAADASGFYLYDK